MKHLIIILTYKGKLDIGKCSKYNLKMKKVSNNKLIA